MSMSIKNAETERLARQVAGETGESLTEAIQRALEERLGRLRREKRRHLLRERLEEIVRRIDALPSLDTRPDHEILGYDEEGIPR